MILQLTPFIPEFITVHLGNPDTPAEDVTLSFPDYIKNVASSEIYPTWPENAIRANLYAQISYALNRVYTEFYRSRGYDFDITNTTQHDQRFIKDREIFENISMLVDDVFNNYVVRQGSIEPLFTAYCNGTTSTCDGLSQWGSVALANQGYLPYEILQHYYGDDINIVMNAPISANVESYRGFPMRIGSAGNEVFILQKELNRIAVNYPAIPRITRNFGLFDVDTESSVKVFQKIFDLTQDGIVGKSTWYKLKYIYNGIKKLSELTSEGLAPHEISLPFPIYFQEGAYNEHLKSVQYHINVINLFYPQVPYVQMNGIFDQSTKKAIQAFQKMRGIPADGIVEKVTWAHIEEVYDAILAAIPKGNEENKAVLFPNYYFSKGMADSNVTLLQTYLLRLAENYPYLLKVPVTGVFDDQTEAAVIKLQELYGLDASGIVGPLTWYQIAQLYDNL